MKSAPFDYVVPKDISEAIAVLSQVPGSVALAGGQSLVPLMASRKRRPCTVVDLNGLGMAHIGTIGKGEFNQSLSLGALVRHSMLEDDTSIRTKVAVLAEAASDIGYRAIRNRGTVGGSLAYCHPAAELPTALMALGATVIVQESTAKREISVSEIPKGAFSNCLDAGELLVEIRVPLPSATTGSAWQEYRRDRSEFALVGAAAVLRFDSELNCISASAAGSGLQDTPVDLSHCLQALIGQRRLSQTLLGTLDLELRKILEPVSDMLATQSDRLDIASHLLIGSVRLAWRRAMQTHEPGVHGPGVHGPGLDGPNHSLDWPSYEGPACK